MIEKVSFKTHISVAQKTAASPSSYGEGHNYWVETAVTAPLPYDEDEVRRRIQAVIVRLDHKALGTDVDLGVVPTSPAICDWLFQQLQPALLPARLEEVVMWRGDGYRVSVRP